MEITSTSSFPRFSKLVGLKLEVPLLSCCPCQVKAECFLCWLFIGLEGKKIIPESIAHQMPGAVLIHFSKEGTFGAVVVIGKPPNQIHDKGL